MALVNAVKEPQGLKKEDFQKMEKTVFTQSTSVPNFNMIRPLLTSLGCLEVLGKKGSQGPKRKFF